MLGTRAIATLIAVYGFPMTPLGWGWAGVVWGYALIWFLVEDRLKLATHWWLDRHPQRPTGPQARPRTAAAAAPVGS